MNLSVHRNEHTSVGDGGTMKIWSSRWGPGNAQESETRSGVAFL
jgi:hypothetical protein